jgi:hypothetical protein
VHGGDYWRLLTPGQYIITAYRDGYHPLRHRVNVYDRPHQEARRLDFHLQPVPQLVSSSVSKAPGSRLRRKTGLSLTAIVQGFPQSLQANVGAIPYYRPQSPPPIFFLTCLSVLTGIIDIQKLLGSNLSRCQLAEFVSLF